MQGLSHPFEAARYHSLVIDREGFPDDALEVTAWTEDGTVMGVRHRQYPHIQVRVTPRAGVPFIPRFYSLLAILCRLSDVACL